MAFERTPEQSEYDTYSSARPNRADDAAADRKLIVGEMTRAGVAASSVDSVRRGIGASILSGPDGALVIPTGDLGILLLCDRTSGDPLALSGMGSQDLQKCALATAAAVQNEELDWRMLGEATGLIIVRSVDRMNPADQSRLLRDGLSSMVSAWTLRHSLDSILIG